MKKNKKRDVILCGVGGQGVLTVAGILAEAAVADGLTVRQSEVHGMAQRGGAVVAHLRMAEGPIAGDLIPRGRGDMVLGMEPLETLRYREYLRSVGVCVTATDPFPNIADYPKREWLEQALSVYRNLARIEADALAREAGTLRARNVVMVGAASRFLPLSTERLSAAVEHAFAAKGRRIVEINLRALRLGRDASVAIAV